MRQGGHGEATHLGRVAASGTSYEARRLGALDGLRGVAVLLVLWYHVWEISWLPAPVPWLQFVPETGFVGVLLFFFLSGFVIAYPFLRAQASAGPPPSWRHFAWRRALKIVPSYALSIALAFAIGYAQRQPGGANAWDVVTHLLFVHTWFDATYGSINGVLWTLAVEVEFYALFPLIWWCFKRRPILTFAAMVAIAWAWRSTLLHCCYFTRFTEWEENLPGYLDIFACGMLCAYAYVGVRVRRPTRGLQFVGTALAAFGFLAAIGLLESLYGFRFVDQWAGVWQVDRRPLLGMAFAAIAFGALTGPRWWTWLLDNAVLRFMAAISYNLYLYHQMIARELLAHHLPPYRGSDPHLDFGWQVRYTWTALVATIAQATLFTYAFERPLLRLPEPWSHRRAPRVPPAV